MAYEHNPFADDDRNPFEESPGPASSAAPPQTTTATSAAARPAPGPAPAPPAVAVPPSAIFAPSDDGLSSGNVFASPKREEDRLRESGGTPAASPAPWASQNPFKEEEDAGNAGEPAAAASTDPLALDKSRKNWPRCYPFLRLAIDQDIPLGHQLTVRMAYAGFLVALSATLANMLVYIVLIARRSEDAGNDNSNTGNVLGLVAAPGYVLLEAVVGWWVLKYLYNGVANDRGRAYCCYFVCGGARMVFLLLGVVGITGTYFCGAVMLVDVATNWHDEGVEVCVAACTAFWALALLVNGLTFLRANRAYRGKGQEGLREVQREATGVAARSLLENAA